MGQQNDEATDKTYRAIERFIFEFSQVEYTIPHYVIPHYVAQEIGLKGQFFSAVMESQDVSMLIAVAGEVYSSSSELIVTAPVESESAAGRQRQQWPAGRIAAVCPRGGRRAAR